MLVISVENKHGAYQLQICNDLRAIDYFMWTFDVKNLVIFAFKVLNHIEIWFNFSPNRKSFYIGGEKVQLAKVGLKD